MAIERNLEAGLQKAVRSLEIKLDGLSMPSLQDLDTETLYTKLDEQTDERFFIIMELLRHGETIDLIHSKTNIDLFFLRSFNQLINLETEIKQSDWQNIDKKEELLSF